MGPFGFENVGRFTLFPPPHTHTNTHTKEDFRGVKRSHPFEESEREHSEGLGRRPREGRTDNRVRCDELVATGAPGPPAEPGPRERCGDTLSAAPWRMKTLGRSSANTHPRHWEATPGGATPPALPALCAERRWSLREEAAIGRCRACPPARQRTSKASHGRGGHHPPADKTSSYPPI